MKQPVISVYCIEGDPRSSGSDDIRIARSKQRDGSVKWAVRRIGNCLNKQGEWEYEPMPSSRDEEFLARCRFNSVEEAFAASGVTLPVPTQMESADRKQVDEHLQELERLLRHIELAARTPGNNPGGRPYRLADARADSGRALARLGQARHTLIGTAAYLGTPAAGVLDTSNDQQEQSR